MRKIFITAFAAAMVMLSSSCVRDVIHNTRNTYFINYIIDTTGILYNKPKYPELMWLRLYDVNTNKRIREQYVYPQGTYINLDPGYSTFVAYNHSNTSTKITYPEDLSILTAETEILEESPYTVIAAPAHFFYGQLTNKYVPYVSEDDDIYRIDIPMRSPLDSWRIIVTGIKNLKNARSITFFVTNQYQDILLGTMTREGNAIISFTGYTDSRLVNVETDFNTFGMVEDRPYEVQIHITDAASFSYRKTVDVTSQVRDSLNTRHILTFDYDITLQEMTQGGLAPSTDEWDSEYIHYTIQ